MSHWLPQQMRVGHPLPPLFVGTGCRAPGHSTPRENWSLASQLPLGSAAGRQLDGSQ